MEIRAWDGSLLEELNGDETGTFEADLPPYQEFFVIVSSENIHQHPLLVTLVKVITPCQMVHCGFEPLMKSTL